MKTSRSWTNFVVLFFLSLSSILAEDNKLPNKSNTGNFNTLSENISIQNQTDVVDLNVRLRSQGITTIQGNVGIAGTGVTDLSILPEIDVEGSLTISSTGLASLAGLGRWGIRNNISITQNTNLVSLAEFPVGNPIIQGSITITDNPELISIEGLAGITGIVGDNDFSSFEGTLQISRNPKLLSLNGLQNIQNSSADFRVQVSENDLLTDVSGLSGVVANQVDFGQNLSLSTLNISFGNFNTFFITVPDNGPLFVDASNFGAAVNTTFQITGNNLETIIGPVGLTTIGDIFMSGSNNLKNVLGWDSLVTSGSISISKALIFPATVEVLPLFPNLTTVNGGITISHTLISTLESFQNLESVSNGISISENPNLLSACGLYSFYSGLPANDPRLGNTILGTRNGATITAQTILNDGPCGGITLIPDPQFEAFLASLGLDNDPAPGQVVTSDIETITSLSINLTGTIFPISSLEGIQDFTALQNLEIGNYIDPNGGFSTNFNTLDLNSLSNLESFISRNVPTLANLNVSGNPQLRDLRLNEGSTITNLDLSNNTALRIFLIEDNSNFTGTFDFTGYANLASVSIINSNPSGVTLDGNSQLISASFTDSRINTLVVRNLPGLSNNLNLTNSTIEDLSIENIGGLTELNVSNTEVKNLIAAGNTDLTTVELPTNNTVMEAIRLSGNRNLNQLVLPSTDSALTSLEILVTAVGFNNNFFQLSSFPLLEDVYLFDVSSEEVVISQNSLLQSVKIEESAALNYQINENPLLTDFEFINNANGDTLFLEENLSLQAFTAFSAIHYRNLRNISILGCDFRNLDLTSLINLESLNATDNPNLTALDFTQISSDPLNPSKLRVFEMTNTPISSLDFTLNPFLEQLFASNSSGQGALVEVNLKNGNNGVLIDFEATGQPNLSCIEVDDVAVAEQKVLDTQWRVAPALQFSTDCSAVNAPVVVTAELYADGQLVVDDVEEGSNLELRLSSVEAVNQQLNFSADVLISGTNLGNTPVSPFGDQTVNYDYTQDGSSVLGISISDNLVVSSFQELSITLSNPSIQNVEFENANNGSWSISPQIQENDDNITATLSATNGIEGAQDIALTVSLRNPDGQDLTTDIDVGISFDVELINGTAIEGQDFQGASEILTFGAGNDGPSKTIFFPVIDDTDIEGAENLQATIAVNSEPGFLNITTVPGSPLEVLIEDNDEALVDTDDDGIPDETDADDDNDGTPDAEDAFPLDETEDTDTDGDGIGNNGDTDDDNDGTPDTEDAFPLDETEDTDTDGDGIGNNADTDDDNDGSPDTEDAFPLDETEDTDTDGDGIGDNADPDANGDGIPDDEVDTDGDGLTDDVDTDDDNDGTPDTEDDFPVDETEDTDTDIDGVGDNADTDDDNDGTPDTEDAFPLDETEDTDTDGDGIGNNTDTDDDNDGTPDTEDAFPLDENEDTDTDGDGIGDNADPDANGDGVPDDEVDTDGDGLTDGVDEDDDNDGTPDTEDDFPLDATEDTDTDGDGVGNNADTDDDGDGTPDTEDAFPLDETEDTDTDGDGIGDNTDTDEIDTNGEWLQSTKLVPSDGSLLQKFGSSVSISGDIAIVGNQSLPVAYIFERSTSGIWLEKAKLSPTSNPSFGGPSSSVAVFGNFVIVGIYLDRNENGVRSGAAYVFERNSEGLWIQHSKLLADDGDHGDYFGRSVAINGNIAIVGAPGDRGTQIGQGSAYIFERDSSGTWFQKTKITASDPNTGDRFGWSVSISDNYALVGVPDDDDFPPNSGSAYIFERNSAGTWTQQPKLLADDGSATDYFGWSVSISGNTAIIGAYADDNENGNFSGSAYIFERNISGVWSQSKKLIAADGDDTDYFGWSVGINGDSAIIGAQFDEENGSNSGSAYIFDRGPQGIWSQRKKLTASDGSEADQFGFSVSLGEEHAIIGAVLGTENFTTSGAAYIFSLLEEVDSDNDGVPDDDDAFPLDETEDTDTDGDGQGDNADTDDDNDGIPDAEDDFPRDDTESNDTDEDGVGDNSDNCPNSPNPDQSDSDNDGVGDSCEQDTFSFEFPAFAIKAISATCPGEANGKIEISSNELVEGDIFTVTVSGNNDFVATDQVSLTNAVLVFENLAAGSYEVCFVPDEDTSLAQCFGASIGVYDRIVATSLVLDEVNLQVQYELSGSTSYEIVVNGATKMFNFGDTSKKNIALDLKPGENTISVSGESACQGVVTDTIIIGNSIVYPNPVSERLYFTKLLGNSLTIQIFDVSGNQVFRENRAISNGTTNVDLTLLSQGTYFVRATSSSESLEFKILKK